MLDGVGWAALEIVVFMVAATLVGFAIGWVFVGWLQRGSIAAEYDAELAAQQELARKAEYRLSESNESLDKLQLELKGASEKVGELEAQLETSQASVAELEGSTAVSDAEAEVAAVRSDLSAAVADLEACNAERDRLAAQIGDLETSVTTSAERIAALEAELVAARAVPESSPEPVAPAAVPPEEDAPTKEEGLARIAEIAARTSGGTPAADDDLKKVHGIGPKLERTLKGLGISSFRQIANFEAEDIAYVTAALDAFKGRIERDDWMNSAAAEHAKKYNEPV